VSSDGDDGLTQFINGDTSGDGIPIVSVANPVNWGRLGQTIGTSIITTVVVGVTNVIAAVTDAWVSIIGGLTAFIEGGTEWTASSGYPVEVEVDGLFDVTLGAVAAAYGDAFAFSSAQFGLLALPINVGIVLVTIYVASVGFQAAASKLFGGG